MCIDERFEGKKICEPSILGGNKVQEIKTCAIQYNSH